VTRVRLRLALSLTLILALGLHVGSANGATGGCTPTKLVPAVTGLISSFSVPSGFPVALDVIVTDDCGNAINNAQVVATFSNGDRAVTLVFLNNGMYSGIWTPVNVSAQVTVQFLVTAPGFSSATTSVTVGSVSGTTVPAISAGGVVDSANPVSGAALAPGSFVTIYGTNLAASTSAATTLPLPTSLANTSVVVGGEFAPILYASPGQINAIIPNDLAPNQQYVVIVDANNALTTPSPLQLATAAPGVFAFADGQVIAQAQDGSLISETNPAARGSFIVIYCSGLGSTNPPVITGTASPSGLLATTSNQTVVTVNGVNASVLFAGLTPTLAGLYQINLQVPAGVPNGDLQLVVYVVATFSNGDPPLALGSSNVTILPVQ
jgi:uncharacterized protein (TIGR03437 family)